MSEDRDLQFEVARTILAAVDEHGFVLAGSGAIREHGIVDRLTRDVDLFTNRYDAAEFDRAVSEASVVLASAGYVVEERRRAEYFAHLNVTAADGLQVDVDFAYDWRGAEPTRLQVGPVLSVDDAVASKTNAVYTRLEARDLIDLDAIRSSGRYRRRAIAPGRRSRRRVRPDDVRPAAAAGESDPRRPLHRVRNRC